MIGSGTDLLPTLYHLITWSTADLLTEPLRTHFNGILLKIDKFSFNKMRWNCHLQYVGKLYVPMMTWS